MAAKPLRQLKAKPAKSREPAAPAREVAAAVAIARSIEEDIVLGRRQPRERLIEQDFCDRFTLTAATCGWRCSSWRRRDWSNASPIAAPWCAG